MHIRLQSWSRETLTDMDQTHIHWRRLHIIHLPQPHSNTFGNKPAIHQLFRACYVFVNHVASYLTCFRGYTTWHNVCVSCEVCAVCVWKICDEVNLCILTDNYTLVQWRCPCSEHHVGMAWSHRNLSVHTGCPSYDLGNDTWTCWPCFHTHLQTSWHQNDNIYLSMQPQRYGFGLFYTTFFNCYTNGHSFTAYSTHNIAGHNLTV